MGRSLLDLTGRRFGHLVAKRPAGREANAAGHVQWLCDCDCGGTHVARAANLTANRTTRCRRCAREDRIAGLMDGDARIADKTVVVDVWYHAAGEQGGFAVASNRAGHVLACTPWSKQPQQLAGPTPKHVLTLRCMDRLVEAQVIRPRNTRETAAHWLAATHVQARAHLFTPMATMHLRWIEAQAGATPRPADQDG